MHKITKSIALLAGFFLAALCVRAQAAQITIAWDDNSTNEDGFIVERAPAAPSTTFTEINRVAANVKTYTDLNLPNKTSFQYRIRAFNADTISAPSNVATGTTPPAPLNPPSNNRIAGTIALLPGEKSVLYAGTLLWNGGSGKLNVRYEETKPMQRGDIVVVYAQ